MTDPTTAPVCEVCGRPRGVGLGDLCRHGLGEPRNDTRELLACKTIGYERLAKQAEGHAAALTAAESKLAEVTREVELLRDGKERGHKLHAKLLAERDALRVEAHVLRLERDDALSEADIATTAHKQAIAALIAATARADKLGEALRGLRAELLTLWAWLGALGDVPTKSWDVLNIQAWARSHLRDVDAALAAVPASAGSDEVLALRRLLWLRHGCHMASLYGDDGEMQCAACLLDFKRLPAADIEERWRQINLQKLASVGSESGQDAAPPRVEVELREPRRYYHDTGKRMPKPPYMAMPDADPRWGMHSIRVALGRTFKPGDRLWIIRAPNIPPHDQGGDAIAPHGIEPADDHIANRYGGEVAAGAGSEVGAAPPLLDAETERLRQRFGYYARSWCTHGVGWSLACSQCPRGALDTAPPRSAEPAALEWLSAQGQMRGGFGAAFDLDGLRFRVAEHERHQTTIHVWRPTLAAAKAECERIARDAKLLPAPSAPEAEPLGGLDNDWSRQK